MMSKVVETLRAGDAEIDRANILTVGWIGRHGTTMAVLIVVGGWGAASGRAPTDGRKCPFAQIRRDWLRARPRYVRGPGLVPDPHTWRYAASMAATLPPTLMPGRSIVVLAGPAWAAVLGPRVQICRVPGSGTPVWSKADGRLYARTDGPLRSILEQGQHGN